MQRETMASFMVRMAVLCVAFVGGCSASVAAGDVALTVEEANACIPGVWVRPAQPCRCDLLVSPQCDLEECQQFSVVAHRADGSMIEAAARTGVDGNRVLIGSLSGVSRGEWSVREEGGELQLIRELGFGSSIIPRALRCSPGELQWGPIVVSPAGEDIVNFVEARWDEDVWAVTEL